MFSIPSHPSNSRRRVHHFNLSGMDSEPVPPTLLLPWCAVHRTKWLFSTRSWQANSLNSEGVMEYVLTPNVHLQAFPTLHTTE